MATITITGDPKHIYNIVKEQGGRVRRGFVKLEGDVENPKAKNTKPPKKEAKPDLKTKEEKGGPSKDKEEDGKEEASKGTATKKPAAKKRPAAKKTPAK